MTEIKITESLFFRHSESVEEKSERILNKRDEMMKRVSITISDEIKGMVSTPDGKNSIDGVSVNITLTVTTP